MHTWPLLQNQIRRGLLNHTFGWVRTNRDGSKRAHQGWDFFAPVDTFVYAVGEGKVEFIGNHGAHGLHLCHSFQFNNKTHYAFYSHLAAVHVNLGATVSIDEIIALTGKSGNAENLPLLDHHLHFEVREKTNCGLGLGGRISPFKLFKHCPLHAVVDGNQVFT